MSANKLPQNNTDIEEALNSIVVREPVVGGNIDEKSIEKIDHQWLIATEIARRAIKNSDVCNVLTSYNTMPLSESIPYDAINKIADSNDNMARLAKHYSNELGVFLNYNEVPNDVLVPDITYATAYTGIEDEKRVLSHIKQYSDAKSFGQLLDSKKNDGIVPGVTKSERVLVARRYRYARDIKMLGLMAELHDQPVDMSNIENGLIKHELKSGVRIGIVSEDFDLVSSILDTENWENRRQIKDRVFEVTVDNKEYIMKERKTNRHTDTMNHGHIDGLTSEQEFEVARKLSGLGTIERGDIQLKWEKPLGYVEFPDGYQFCLFESDPDLKTMDGSDLTRGIEQEIMKSMGRYQVEYDDVRLKAKEIYEHRRDLCGYAWEDGSRLNLIEFIKNIFHSKKEHHDYPLPDELTVEEFVELKAKHLQSEAFDLLRQTALDNGYVNKDLTGHVISLRPNQQPFVEITGFDFEYYVSDQDEATRLKTAQENSLTNGDSVRSNIHTIGGDRPIMTAASYALLENAGYTLPPVVVN
jgi:hypothetical protein